MFENKALTALGLFVSQRLRSIAMSLLVLGAVKMIATEIVHNPIQHQSGSSAPIIEKSSGENTLSQ